MAGGERRPEQRRSGTRTRREWRFPTRALSCEDWYGALGSQTFPTQFIHLDPMQIETLLELQKGAVLGKGVNRDEIGEEGRLVLHQLEQAVAATGQRGAAVRVGSVSPKDSTRAVRSTYEAELAKQLGLANPIGEGAIGAVLGDMGEAPALSAEVESNCKLIAWSVACVQGLRHRSGIAAFDSLMRSERVATVFGKAVAGAQAGLNIAVRSWDSDVRHEYLFRGFVRHGKLTALTQFNQFCFFASLLPIKESLQRRLVAFWESEVSPKCGNTASYVMDLAAHKDRIVLVNLHQYVKETSASLFDWEADQEVLEHGPFEFRLREAPMDGAAQFVEIILAETQFE